MDPRNSAQDIIRCDQCETPVPPLYCDICHINLCKTCVGNHLLDESKLHIVVPIKHRQPIPSYPKCPEHAAKRCELHCEQCDIPVCVQCVSSKKHKAHDVEDISKFLEGKKKDLKADLEELGKSIYPLYQEIASSFQVQKANLKKNTEELIKSLNERENEWHRELDNIVRKFKSDIEKAESEYLAVLKTREDEINQRISEITQSTGELKKLLDSNDGCLLSTCKSRNAEFRRLPPKVIVDLPSFCYQSIDTDQVIQQFGTLIILSIRTEERLYTKESLDTNNLHSNITQPHISFVPENLDFFYDGPMFDEQEEEY